MSPPSSRLKSESRKKPEEAGGKQNSSRPVLEYFRFWGSKYLLSLAVPFPNLAEAETDLVLSLDGLAQVRNTFRLWYVGLQSM
jgi:hypothetical protein